MGSTPISYRLEDAAAPLFEAGSNPRILLLSDSKGADTTAKYGELLGGLQRSIVFADQVVSLSGRGCDNIGPFHALSSAITQVTNTTKTTYAPGDVGHNSEAPAHITQLQGGGSAPTGTYIQYHFNTGADTNTGNTDGLQRFNQGDPFSGVQATVRTILSVPASNPWPDMVAFHRRNGANTGVNGVVAFPTTAGLQKVDITLAAVAGSPGYAAIENSSAANKTLRLCGTRAMRGTGPSAGVALGTLGHGGYTVGNHLALVGDDGGSDLASPITTTCSQARCQTYLNYTHSGAGDAGGPTDIWVFVTNMDLNVASAKLGGISESAALQAGNPNVTIALYQRLINSYNTICTNLNGSNPRFLLIVPEFASYGGSPYVAQATQDLIGHAREAAYLELCRRNINVRMVSIYGHFGDVPAVCPYHMDGDWTHYLQPGSVVPAVAIAGYLRQAWLLNRSSRRVVFDMRLGIKKPRGRGR